MCPPLMFAVTFKSIEGVQFLIWKQTAGCRVLAAVLLQAGPAAGGQDTWLPPPDDRALRDPFDFSELLFASCPSGTNPD